MKKVCALVFLILLALLSCSVYAAVQEARTAPAVCGNNIKENGEACDGSDLGGASCASQGYTGGSLSCNSNCAFNTSSCSSGGGGGGGGGVYISPPPLPPKPTLPTGDFNGDGFINFRDLSILLYWFSKTGPEITSYDLNGDKKINFVDVSILLYRWQDK